MDVTLNIDIPDIDEQQYPNENPVDIMSRLIWEKYEAFLMALRNVCTAQDRIHEFRVTSDSFQPPLCNVIFEATDNPIAVTLKCERSTVYFIAVRKGRGEPQAANPQNNRPWRQCSDFNLMPGTENLPFGSQYDQDNRNLASGSLGFMALRNAVFGLHSQREEDTNFHSLCILVAEPVRYDLLVRYYQERIENNYSVSFPLTQEMILLIKNWGYISSVVQRHLILGAPFRIDKIGLNHYTLNDVRRVVGLLKFHDIPIPPTQRRRH